MGRLPVVLTLVLVSTPIACDKAGTQAPVTLATETARDPSGAVEVEMAYLPKPERQIELRFRLEAIGVEEMDKIVLEVKVRDLYVLEGQVEWNGFVPPRQPQTHSLTVGPAKGAEDAAVTVSVRRSVDSELLMQTEIPFAVTEDGLRPL